MSEQGGIGDSFVMRGAVEELGELLEDMKATGLPSGIGSHSIETTKAVAAAGIRPDFFVRPTTPTTTGRPRPGRSGWSSTWTRAASGITTTSGISGRRRPEA